MARQQRSGLIPWLLLAVIGLIAYGSLYPFDFSFDSQHPTLTAALQELSWARAGRADRVRNVLLYAPLGFCLMLWLRHRGVLLAALLATLLGLLLSLCIELAQVYLSIRVPSLRDMVLNAAGSLLGALAGVVWRSLSGLVYLPPNTRHQPGDRSALLVLCAWVLWRLADFEVNFSLTRLKQALRPLLEWNFSLPQVLQYLLFWLVVAQAVLSYVSRQRANEVLLAVIAIVLGGRLLLVTPAFIPSELLALLLLLPALVLLHRMQGVPQSVLVLALFALYFLQQRLAPYHFGSAHSFDFWPFMSWIQSGMPIDFPMLLGKLFQFAALMWLLKDAGLPMRSAVLGVAASVLALETVQLWQPGKISSFTDPVLALGMGWLMRLVSDEPRTGRRSSLNKASPLRRR